MEAPGQQCRPVSGEGLSHMSSHDGSLAVLALGGIVTTSNATPFDPEQLPASVRVRPVGHHGPSMCRARALVVRDTGAAVVSTLFVPCSAHTIYSIRHCPPGNVRPRFGLLSVSRGPEQPWAEGEPQCPSTWAPTGLQWRLLIPPSNLHARFFHCCL